MKTSITIALLFFVGIVFSQESDSIQRNETPHYIGLGLGMDYGGVGLKLEVSPIHFLGVFGSAGYNFHKYVFNGGIMLKPNSNTKVMPYFLAMYGYNGVVVIQGVDEYDRTFDGFTAGFGISITTKHSNKWVIGVNVPIRNNQFSDYYEELKNNPDIKFDSDPLPFAFTVGYNIRLN